MKKLTYLFSLLWLTLTVLTATSCSTFEGGEANYPGTPEEERRKRLGSLTGEGGLIALGRDKEEESGSSGIGINSYLWRATLDTISFMPLSSADPFGGVIITDWYEDPDARGERFKLNVMITSQSLRSDAVTVSVFKQEYGGSAGWQDAGVSQKVARDLENKILTRARELRIKKERS